MADSVKVSDLTKIPNLLTLARIGLTPFIGYFLYLGDERSSFICLGLLFVAGISDALDGYLARKLNQQTELGRILDPIADKIMAAILVVLMILFRDFPWWLALTIVGRDLLILLGGLLLLRGEKVIVPSNLTGKYAFASIAVLLASYVLRFDFGIILFTWTTLILLSMSLFVYVRIFMKVKAGLPVSPFEDKAIFMSLRLSLSLSLGVVYLWKLYLHLSP